MTWPLRMTRLRTLRWPRRGDEPQSLPRQVESIAEALDDDDGAADSTTATPKSRSLASRSLFESLRVILSVPFFVRLEESGWQNVSLKFVARRCFDSPRVASNVPFGFPLLRCSKKLMGVSRGASWLSNATNRSWNSCGSAKEK